MTQKRKQNTYLQVNAPQAHQVRPIGLVQSGRAPRARPILRGRMRTIWHSLMRPVWDLAMCRGREPWAIRHGQNPGLDTGTALSGTEHRKNVGMIKSTTCSSTTYTRRCEQLLADRASCSSGLAPRMLCGQVARSAQSRAIGAAPHHICMWPRCARPGRPSRRAPQFHSQIHANP